MLTAKDLINYANPRERNLATVRKAAAFFVTCYDEHVAAVLAKQPTTTTQYRVEMARDDLSRVSRYEENNIAATLERAKRKRRIR